MRRLSIYSILLSGLFAIGLSGCGGGNDDDGPTQITCNKLPGDKYAGGKFRLNESEFIRTLYPHAIIDASSSRTASQIFEGLLKRDAKTLNLEPGLASEWSLDSSKTVYTFKLRKGVKFHDNPCFENGKGREFTAEDVKWCFTKLCTFDEQNMNAGFSSIFKGVLKGASEYYEATVNKTPLAAVEGIKVINDYEIQLILEEPNSVFLERLAGPYGMIFAKESLEKYSIDVRINPVGTGPFMIEDPEKHVSEGNMILLTKNPNYWGTDEFGNKLPFLDFLEIRFINTKMVEMTEFKMKKLDMIYKVPSDYIIDILKDQEEGGNGEYAQYKLQRKAEMATHMLAFRFDDELFKDINLRKAFSFAIDRIRILEFIFDGEGDGPGFNGITPGISKFSDKGYNTDNIKGYSYLVDSARYYFNMTDYGKNNKEFPTLNLYLNPDGQRNMQVAEEVQNQLRTALGIDIKIEPIPRAQFGEKVMGGKLNFFRLGWIADYPHPQAFLYQFYGKDVPEDPNAPSYPNIMRYKNEEFDKLYELGMNAGNDEEAYKYFMEAEQVLMDDCPFISLWYEEGYRLLQPYVKDFYDNEMQYRDFSKVYFDCPQEINAAEKP